MNQIMSIVPEDVELRLRIHDLQDRLHPKTSVHPSLHVFQFLAPPQDKNIEVKCDSKQMSFSDHSHLYAGS